MGFHKNLGGVDLHPPQGKSPTPLQLDDDTPSAYLVEDTSSNVYFHVDTTNSAEEVTIGNTTTNPKLLQAGTGDVGLGTTSPTSPNGNAKVVEIEGASVGVVLHSTNGGGTPYEIQNNSETLKIQYDTTNRMTVDNSGNIGFGADPSSPNGNAKVVEVKDTSVGLVLNSTNGGAAPWEMQHNSGDMKIIYDGANTLGGGAKTAIALDAAGRMRLGAEAASPSAPSAGDGGYVYVKSDGKLYYISNSTTETDLTASGSGWDGTSGSSPALGGNLDCNGNDIDVEAGSAIAVSGGSIQATTGYGVHDEADNEQLLFTKTTTAVSYLNIQNAATGGEATAATSTAPILSTAGESNVDLALAAAGTGTVTIRGNTNSGTLSLNNPANTFAVHLKPRTDLGADYTLILPADDGTPNQVLETDGSGNLSWVTPSAGGGGGYTVEAKSASFTAAVDYYYVIDSSAAVRTATLPSPSGQSGKKIGFKARHGSSNAVTLDRATNAANIDGAAIDYTLNNNMGSLELICDGTDWWII